LRSGSGLLTRPRMLQYFHAMAVAKNRAQKHNPKGAAKSEQSQSILRWVPLLWHHVEANRPDLIRAAKGPSVGVKNLLAGACGTDDKSKDILQRKLYEAALDFELKVEVNRAMNAPKDQLALMREAQVKDAEISAMIELLERAKADAMKV